MMRNGEERPQDRLDDGVAGEDRAIASSLAEVGARMSPPSERATLEAATSLHAQLARLSATTRPGWRVRSLAWAAALVAISAVSAGAIFVLSGGGSARARAIEGVVVEVDDTQVWIQTLSGLEAIEVPGSLAPVDSQGTPIAAESLAPGQVLSIDAEERDGVAVASQLTRRAGGLEDWCGTTPGRCEALSQQLATTAGSCEADPASCIAPPGRVEALHERAAACAANPERCSAATVEPRTAASATATPAATRTASEPTPTATMPVRPTATAPTRPSVTPTPGAPETPVVRPSSTRPVAKPSPTATLPTRPAATPYPTPFRGERPGTSRDVVER